MKVRNNFKLFLIGLFSILLAFICFSNNASAATVGPYAFNDGITNWSSTSTNKVGELPIDGNNLQLGYAFGLAQNTSGKVTTGGDDTVTKDSVSNGINTQYSKMNVFLNNSGNYISSVYQGGYTNPSSIKENVSPTSPNFMIAPSTAITLNGITSTAFSILGNPGSSNGTGNTGLSNKAYYYGTDANGNPAYKITGHFTRSNNSGYKNGNYDMDVEILLRPSPTNSAIVQREMYVKNTASTAAEFVTLFGEDTKLGDSSGGNDKVPVYDLGNKEGLYIGDTYNNNEFRLMVTNQTPDGFDSYNGQARSDNWAAGLTNGYVTGTGAETNNNPKGTQLTGYVDTAYILKWNSTTLAPGQTAHFGSTIGVTAKPYSIPTPSKTYKNETRSDGTNKVGDKLKFNLKITNNGYGAKWNYNKLVDVIPKGLQVDPSTLKLTDDNGATQILDPSDYNASTNTITIPPALTLTDEQHATVTFEAQITSMQLAKVFRGRVG